MMTKRGTKHTLGQSEVITVKGHVRQIKCERHRFPCNRKVKYPGGTHLNDIGTSSSLSRWWSLSFKKDELI